MNRGFGFYFGQAMKTSSKTVWKKGNFIRYISYLIMNFLAFFTVILGAMLSLADIRQARLAKSENAVDVPRSFKVACRAKPFWNAVLAFVLEALIFLSGVVIIALVSSVLGLLGYIVSIYTDALSREILILIFTAPGLLVLAVYSVIMPLLFAPTAYVIETNPEISAAEAVSVSIDTMRTRGKFTCFLSLFVTFLLEALILVIGAVGVFLIQAFVEDAALCMALSLLVGAIFVIAFVAIAPLFSLARKITLTSLFDDIILDRLSGANRLRGVNITKCKGVKFEPDEYREELTTLFDETNTDRIPVTEKPSERRKREKEERKRAKLSEFVNKESPAAAPSAAPEDTVSFIADSGVENIPAPPPAEDENAAAESDDEILTVSDLIRGVEPSNTVEDEESFGKTVDAEAAPLFYGGEEAEATTAPFGAPEEPRQEVFAEKPPELVIPEEETEEEEPVTATKPAAKQTTPLTKTSASAKKPVTPLVKKTATPSAKSTTAKPAAKPATTRPTATKPATASKPASTAARPTAAKPATATKPASTATRPTAAKPATATKPASTATRPTAAKPATATKSATTATRPMAAKSATASKPASTATHPTAAKPATATKPATTATRPTAAKPATATKPASTATRPTAAKPATASKPATTATRPTAAKPATATKPATTATRPTAAKPATASKPASTATRPTAAKPATATKPATPSKTTAAAKKPAGGTTGTKK